MNQGKINKRSSNGFAYTKLEVIIFKLFNHHSLKSSFINQIYKKYNEIETIYNKSPIESDISNNFT